jgi:hypothetical protein
MAGNRLQNRLALVHGRPEGWNNWSDAEKLSSIAGRNLDRISDIMEIDAAGERDLALMTLQVQVFNALMRIRSAALSRELDRRLVEPSLERIEQALKTRPPR